jgi:indole-3-glycerol phosphate synthase
MPDLLDKLIDDATKRIAAGYYDIKYPIEHEPLSLRRAIRAAQKNAIIAEIKPASPSLGPIRPTANPVETAVSLANGGAVALSILTEPDNFGGNIENLQRIRAKVNLPLLMKDIIIDDAQIHAGRKAGADCILLIESVFSKCPFVSLNDMINKAHQNKLEVILEVHNKIELEKALKSEADIVGINNRDLATLHTDINTTIRLLDEGSRPGDKMLISESGFETADDIRRVKLAPVAGFLIGSSIMLSPDLESKVREFVFA